MRRIIVTTTLLLLALSSSALWGNGFDFDAIKGHIKYLSSFTSRSAGYRGDEKTAKYIYEYLSSLPFDDVFCQSFEIGVPQDKGAYLEVEGVGKIPLYCLYPNLVRTPTMPPSEGNLVYVGEGDFANYNGKDVDNGFVLMDFNSGINWMNAGVMGIKAVIFIEPEEVLPEELSSKYSFAPVDMPRFYMLREDAEKILPILKEKGSIRTRLAGRMDWEMKQGCNIIAVKQGRDPEKRNEYVVIEAYYDAASVVPALAPGADSAAGIATLLEIARFFAENPPERSVVIVACDAHFQGIAGAAAFVDAIKYSREDLAKKIKELENYLALREGIPGKGIAVKKVLLARLEGWAKLLEEHPLLPTLQDITLFLGLDLSTHSKQLGVFFRGHYISGTDDFTYRRFFSDAGKLLAKLAKEAADELGEDGDEIFANGINPIRGKEWEAFLLRKVAFDAEAPLRAGCPALTFATSNDLRQYVDSPLDTYDRLDLEKLHTQVRLLERILPKFVSTYEQATKMKLRSDWWSATLRAVEFDPTTGYMPDKPVPGTVLSYRVGAKNHMGVKGFVCRVADEQGCVQFIGYGGKWIDACLFDNETGRLIKARDYGTFGATRYGYWVPGVGDERELIVVMFEARQVDLYDIMDRRQLKYLKYLDVLDARTDSAPARYSFSKSYDGQRWDEPIEPIATVFAPPGIPVKIIMSTGVFGKQLLLLNATPDNPVGSGFVFDKPSIKIKYLPYRAAKDMWILDDYRIGILESKGIINTRLRELHAAAEKALKRAEEALKARKYDAFITAAREAWGLEARAYPDVNKTTADVVKGIIFYMTMLLPFAFFCERLFFAFPDIRQQLAGAFVVFLVVFFIIKEVHPAFEITLTPFLVLLAFMTLMLSILVISLISSKFQDELEKIRRRASKIYRADVGRIAAAGAAFSLGISNMRRRKARTLLTSLTLILLTFTVLSFTSVKSYLRFNRVPLKNPAYYDGMLIRQNNWMALEVAAVEDLKDEFGKDMKMSTRAWLIKDEVGKPFYATAKYGNKRYDFSALLGVSYEEKEITGIDRFIVAGRWFRKGAFYEILLPKAAAENLGIAKEDVGKVKVDIFGREFVVVGIYDDEKLDTYLDLDGEQITPVDYVKLRPEEMQQKQEIQATPESLLVAGEKVEIKHYVHLGARKVAILPVETVIGMGGKYRSCAIRIPNGVGGESVVRKLMQRLALIVFYGKDGEAFQYSSIGATTMRGMTNLFIPILIASLIVLNTMLGSVYERTREIGIYSAVGLAPVHISALFIAEACVYAVLGSIAGYLIGQATAKIISEFNLLPGIALNYSSLTAVSSTILVMVVVLLSTAYPAFKASRLSVPDITRRWELPPPKDETWEIVLPFTLSAGQELGVNAFLADFFNEHTEDASSEGMYCDGTRLEVIDTEEGRGYVLKFRVWIAPFDLGVSQDVEIHTLPTLGGRFYEVRILLRLASGEVASWKRINRRFLNVIRKEFLIWRTLPPDLKEEFIQRGREMV